MLQRLLKISVVLLVAGALGVGCGFGGGGGLTLGYLDWNENVANATLTKVLLEDDLGYDRVELKLAERVPLIYEDLISGETDAFQDAWMPNHQQYVDEGEGQLEVLRAPWYVVLPGHSARKQYRPGANGDPAVLTAGDVASAIPSVVVPPV